MRKPMAVLVLLLLASAPIAFAQEPTLTPVPLPTQMLDITDADSDGDGVPDDADRCDGFVSGATGADATGCPTEFDPFVGLEYDHEPHRLWYGRFWTGSCQGVPGFCLGGDPRWFDVVEEVVVDVPEAEQGVMRNRLWALGRTMGHHWASDPNFRDKQIVTRDLRRWGNQIQRSDDLLTTLVDIEGEVCDRLGATALEGGFSPAPSCAVDVESVES